MPKNQYSKPGKKILEARKLEDVFPSLITEKRTKTLVEAKKVERIRELQVLNALKKASGPAKIEEGAPEVEYAPHISSELSGPETYPPTETKTIIIEYHIGPYEPTPDTPAYQMDCFGSWPDEMNSAVDEILGVDLLPILPDPAIPETFVTTLTDIIPSDKHIRFIVQRNDEPDKPWYSELWVQATYSYEHTIDTSG